MVTNQAVRVLIVDDKRTTRMGLRALLARVPEIEVVGEAVNGLDALALTAALHPDVVLMDVQMPMLDGLEATRQIKQRWPKVKIVVLTVYPQYREPARSTGADVFVLKGGATMSLCNAIVNS